MLDIWARAFSEKSIREGIQLLSDLLLQKESLMLQIFHTRYMMNILYFELVTYDLSVQGFPFLGKNEILFQYLFIVDGFFSSNKYIIIYVLLFCLLKY